MKYYFIAGEASGYLHAANCMKEILLRDPSALFGFTGGDRMTEVSGVKPDIHLREMAFMGFVDVLKNIRTIRKNFTRVKSAILRFQPDLLILVDYPGFNLRMAKWAFQNNIRTDYYISPTVWAWKEGRVEDIRKYTHKLFVILPFEENFYKKHNHRVYFVGHPLIDEVMAQKKRFRTEGEFRAANHLDNRPLIAVLPGSRAQEVERMMHIMLEVMPQFPDYTFVVAGTSSLPSHFFEGLKKQNIPLVFDQTYELMNYAAAGIIKSGTSTLESALLNLPQVVCYKGGALSFAIGKRLVNVKYISLVNLILNREAVKELIQQNFTAENISAELRQVLNNEGYRENILEAYREIQMDLGAGGASAKLAEFLVEDSKG
jgi:lipid-A-disaccharide synthase